MNSRNRKYRALISSDWNGCLAPCGPFDCISFAYPQLAPDLKSIFKQYTNNIISLGDAVGRIRHLLPQPLTEEQMDAYLNEFFNAYKGVPELIEWCRSHHILFMINTTGMIGYFQRVFANNLLPQVPVLSAHPMIRYPKGLADPRIAYDLFETADKSKNTRSVMRSFQLPSRKIIIMGDSGGDGPHFKWGAANDAILIASMAKPSLKKFCAQEKIAIHIQFGLSYADGQDKDESKEMRVNFLDLVPIIESLL